MKRKDSIVLFTSICLTLLIQSCGILDTQQATTKTKMSGLWELTEAYDENGKSIIEDINFPVTAFHLQDFNKIHSTAGPMMMRTIYGDSKYTEIASKIDQIFNYTALTTTDGEWFIEGGYPERFTLEMTLGGVPGQKSITDILDILGITKDNFDVAIYYKFEDIHVSFDFFSNSTMTWKFDNTTQAVYNTKDSRGNLVLWNGWPTNSFTRGEYVFTKRAGSLNNLIQETANY